MGQQQYPPKLVTRCDSGPRRFRIERSVRNATRLSGRDGMDPTMVACGRPLRWKREDFHLCFICPLGARAWDGCSGSAPCMQICAMDADPETSGSWSWQFRTTSVTVVCLFGVGSKGSVSAMVVGDYAAVVARGYAPYPGLSCS